MKNSIIVFACVLLLGFISCNEDRDTTTLKGTFENGSWRITEFVHVGVDETYNYEGYKITFTERETVSASGINFFIGQWDINDDGNLQMDFGRTYWFERFNATWHVTNYNDQMIQLDIVGGTDHLVFEKI